jgi:hypothetical protein
MQGVISASFFRIKGMGASTCFERRRYCGEDLPDEKNNP